MIASRREREIKIAAKELSAVRARLRAAGAEPLRPASLESNLVFDRGDGPAGNRLRSRRELLRLRTVASHSLLTWKSAPRFDGGVKERAEHEFAVDDPDAAVRFLEALGFVVATRYEKVRETWRFDGCEIALDRTPIGDFVEVEQTATDLPAGRLQAICRVLGLDPEKALAGSYLRLYREARRKRPELPSDMVFDQRSAPDGTETCR